MSPTPPQISLRVAEPQDQPLLSRFVHSPAFVHRHLDWRDALDWLGRQPFWILEKNLEIEAALAVPAEPDEVAWVRLFAVSPHASASRAWGILFERALSQIQSDPRRPVIASLALQEWYGNLISGAGFNHHQDIIVLTYEDSVPASPQPLSGFEIRAMQPEDLTEVTRVDNASFEPIWRMSSADLQLAFERSTHKSVAILDGQICGYQMSSLSGFSAHLARLAILPVFQHRGLGWRLLHSVLDHIINRTGTWSVTLNTQDNNTSSLALYRRAGFHLTGEHFPVYVYTY